MFKDVTLTQVTSVSSFVCLFVQLVHFDLGWARPIEQNLIWTLQTEEDATCLERSHQTWGVAEAPLEGNRFKKMTICL